MKQIDKYLLKAFLGPFIMTLIIVLFILIMQFLWLYIDELVGKGLSIWIILEFLAWGSVNLMSMAFPLATLLSAIMTLGGMGENNELLAMKAAGISLSRIMAPLIITSAIISVGAFIVANDLVPVANRNLMALREDINRTKDEIKIPIGTFYDGIDGYILRIDSRDDELGVMHNLMIYDHSNKKGNNAIIIAESGKITMSDDGQCMVFKLHNGRSYNEENTFKRKDTTMTQSVAYFQEQEMIIPLENYTFTRSTENTGKYRDYTLAKDIHALKSDGDSLMLLYNKFKLSYLRDFLFNDNMRYIKQLDTSAVGYRIMNSFPYDSLISNRRTDLQIQETKRALDRARDAEQYIMSYEHSTYRFVVPRRYMNIELFHKFTFSLACLLLFFIGGPLGAIIRKGGLGTPAIISMLFFVLYWVIDIVGTKLAKNGDISPFAGAILATVLMTPISIFLTRKAIQDSSIFNIESYKIFFAKQIHRIKRFINMFKKNKGITKIVYMGTPDFAVAPLESLLNAENFIISAVVTVPDKASGRGLKVNESAVKRFATANNIPVLQPVSLKDPQFIDELKRIDADMFIVVAFRMLPKVVWSMPRLGTFNLHASLLPQYRGAAPINWAIINGDRQSGVTTFLIDEEIDTGKILFREAVLIENYDNAGSLHDQLMVKGAALVVRTAEALVEGKVTPIEQDTHNLDLRPAPKITKETCHIDWNSGGFYVNQLIKGLSPYPGAWSEIVSADGTRQSVKIYEAYIDTEESALPTAGCIKSDGKSYLSVSCGDYMLHILDLQLAGKRRLDIKQFLAGFREPESYHFE